MAAVVTDRDHGYRDLVARLYGAAARRTRIEVGILADKGEEPHGKDGVDIITVANANEFGTTITVTTKKGQTVTIEIPSRSFIRAWFDEAEGKLREDFVALMQSVVRGQRTKEQILELLGQRMVGEIQERIADGVPPPNAPSTVKQKGSSTPLINLGILRSSVSYRVTEER